MFKNTTVTMTLAAIATVVVNLQAPVFAAEPSIDPMITEGPGVPGVGTLTIEEPTLEDALDDYLEGLPPEEGDFGTPVEVATLPDEVLDAIRNPIVDLPGVGEPPPLAIEDTEPPVDELVCGEPGAICDEPDEGAEGPLDPTDVCGDEGVACEFDPTVDGEVMPEDDGWVEPDHDEASYETPSETVESAIPGETVTSTSMVAGGQAETISRNDSDAAPTIDAAEAGLSETSAALGEVASVITTAADEGTSDGFDPATAAMIGIVAAMFIAGLGFGAYKMGHRGA